MPRYVGHISGNYDGFIDRHGLGRGRQLQLKFSDSFLETHIIQSSGKHQLASLKRRRPVAKAGLSATMRRTMTVGFGQKGWWSVLLAAVGLLASGSLWAQGAEVASATPEEKLTAAIEVLQQLDAGAAEVDVIVNLVQPPAKPKGDEWHSRAKLQGWQRAVRARQDEVVAALAAGEFKARHFFENQSGFSGKITRKGLEKLALHPRVASIQPNHVVEPHLAQGIPRINGAVYRSIYNGTNVAIAIVDSGIDYTHPFLGGISNLPNSKVIGGYDFGDSDGNPIPNGNGHGTACAGIAAGNIATNQGDYVGGVAPGAKLYALKITAGSGANATDADIVTAWNWCITLKNDDPNNPILAISTSFGGGKYNSVCDSANTAYAVGAANAVSAGITLLVSSGNEGFCDSLSMPACIQNVISVGGVYDAAYGGATYCIDSRSCVAVSNPGICPTTGYSVSDLTAPDRVAAYSNTADFLGQLAPSHRTSTTDIVGTPGFSAGSYHTNFGGTSASAPYAAGAVAALQSASKALSGRYLTPAEVRTLLTSTGDFLSDPKVIQAPKPRVNLGRAIETLIPPRLTAKRTNSLLVISWATNTGTGYTLEWANAIPAASWSNAPGTRVTSGTNYYITNVITAGTHSFYRLRK